ncbi:MCE family protein [Nocardioides sp. dk4132]|uniref:MCE family protein n=1 Tax=unclassified Nocardioides TaxID=2615069 RepID=UPI001295C759|nr:MULTISPECIES: MCE family protein [unclassified Nocardioides]MQW74556.1 MCE family protein [Nocardioides sp. dk4132]QGA06479.1 MCE family protein [Nocardioides sp. dk884]
MTRLLRRVLRPLTGAVLGALLLTGCDADIYDLPLPGGTDVGADPITVTIMFRDVLDLVPKSTVKVNDVSVGQVKEIELEDYTARVVVELRGDTELPDDTVAEIRQTSLLGEKFVSLRAPEGGGSDEPLESGDTIGLERSGRNPEVEEVLGALSLVLNGGGVAQLKTIAQELNLALEGREDAARSVLTQVDDFAGELDDNKAEIVRAIESLDRLAREVRSQQDTIDAALEELPSALTSIDSQRGDLVRMLRALDRLGDVGVDVISASKEDTIATVRRLQPVLTQLANSGDGLVDAFHVFLTYPFVDEVVGRDPQVARNLHLGDYTNLSVQLDIDLSLGLDGTGTPPPLLPSDANPVNIVSNVVKCIASGRLDSPACEEVRTNIGGVLKLKQECLKPKNEKTVVCRLLNQVPGLPDTGIGPLDDLLGAIGLSRTVTGDAGSVDPRRSDLTVGDLRGAFDPGLVDLLVPGLVADDLADTAGPAQQRSAR